MGSSRRRRVTTGAAGPVGSAASTGERNDPARRGHGPLRSGDLAGADTLLEATPARCGGDVPSDLRERLVMQSLDDAGRQAAALTWYERTRALLAD